jgi:hypothetical protein
MIYWLKTLKKAGKRLNENNSAANYPYNTLSKH